ncbi:hypothetical protein D3OALGA1CA_3084 [Olavius algarvensis associated proteobacterium Delta 3]|nr:hypothetical protein D3OALGA1CA_3084 [Olavius algarvensis associated proteobacterium Delta 3]CAB5158378.1 hypothetical protein D3OALGB2SA_5264 [Olavius algarvensis associated proteobacterium Delta 3]
MMRVNRQNGVSPIYFLIRRKAARKTGMPAGICMQKGLIALKNGGRETLVYQ